MKERMFVVAVMEKEQLVEKTYDYLASQLKRLRLQYVLVASDEFLPADLKEAELEIINRNSKTIKADLLKLAVKQDNN